MSKNIKIIISLVIILIAIGVGFFLVNKFRLKSQPSTSPIYFPSINTTTFITSTPTTTVSIIVPKVQTTTINEVFKTVTSSSRQPKINKVIDYQLTTFGDQYYLLVNKGNIESETKIYMPFNGYVMYYKEDQSTLNFQIYSDDNKITLTFLGALKALCKVSKTEKANVFEGKTYFCNNLKQGDLIAETTQPSEHQNIALQITGFLNNKSSLDILYKYLPIMIK